uniref:Secreted protein n=1 Tax=Strongyloides papillosus TaxID=174720 RepID=A0A0N5BLT8_STREA
MKYYVNFIFVILSGFIIGTKHQESTCDFTSLVKCFIEVLDEWTWTLYELSDIKKNMVGITNDQCQHLRKLEICMDDGNENPHSCTHKEVVEVSNTVSDLITHRKNAGSFLKSYYLLSFACSNEGQKLINENEECFRSEHISEMTISAGTYLSEKFLDGDKEDDDICSDLNEKMEEYKEALRQACNKRAQYLMCKSLESMFKGLHADKLEGCDLNCGSIDDLDEEPEQEHREEQSEPEIGQSNALLNAASYSQIGGSLSTLPVIIVFLLSAIYLNFL